MKRRKLLILFLFAGTSIFAQQAEFQSDSLKNIELKTIEVFGEAKRNIETEMKMAVSIDEFLASSEQISFIKRGAYAWEPLLNNMSTERSTITIDGMHIFGACTDKMDPVTSYVESNNLAGIDIKSGQEGGLHGSTVAGNIELKRKQSRFTTQNGFKGSYQTGFELNNKQFFNLGNVSFSNEKWVADASISYRQAENYFDGNQKEIKHSQFKKLNTSLGVAYKTSELSLVRLDGIFDMAKDVGFPALPMDLWLSRGLITSVSYKQLFEKSVEGPNDFASMEEVVYRRYKRMLDEGETLPQLIVIDGGKGQLSSAVKSLDRLGIRGQVSILGIAKRLEEIFFPDDSIPLYLDKSSETLKVLQHVRNESHRFGLAHHRTRRSNSGFKSELEEIPGVGAKTIQNLLKKFKSIKRIKAASLEELESVVGLHRAEKLLKYFEENERGIDASKN